MILANQKELDEAQYNDYQIVTLRAKEKIEKLRAMKSPEYFEIVIPLHNL